MFGTNGRKDRERRSRRIKENDIAIAVVDPDDTSPFSCRARNVRENKCKDHIRIIMQIYISELENT